MQISTVTVTGLRYALLLNFRTPNLSVDRFLNFTLRRFRLDSQANKWVLYRPDHQFGLPDCEVREHRDHLFMDGCNILVTGANGNLGVAVGRAFLDGSPLDRVWLGVRESDDAANVLVGEYPDRCQILRLDVTSPEAWASAIHLIGAQAQGVDVLVNNAGVHEDQLLARMPLESWSRVMATNLDAAFHGCQGVLPHMISRRWGRIINVSSLSALLAPAGQSSYAAAKSGLIALTRSLAKEVARIGITVNAVCPGYLEGRMTDGMDAEQRKAALSRIPMRRFGQPEEVAGVIRFLASREASYVTGSVLTVDGGIF